MDSRKRDLDSRETKLEFLISIDRVSEADKDRWRVDRATWEADMDRWRTDRKQ